MKLTKQEIIDIKKATRNPSMEPWSDSVAFAENIQAALLKKLDERLQHAKFYDWIRNRPYRYKFGMLSNKVFVVNPSTRLYAVSSLNGDELDSAIQAEILGDMIEHLAFEQEINGDCRFSDPLWFFSNERTDELTMLAKKELGYAA